VNRARRILAATWRQHARSLRCPDTPRLDGKRALVTGGNAGIGLAIAAGLRERGADVVAASRRAGLSLDLADLRSVRSAVEGLARTGARFDIVVCNAGLWPRRHQTSPQGHELAFATNVLGHFALLRGLIAAGALATGARVVIVTGDIYVLAKDCTPDFAFTSPLGGMLAYCRSKLGDLWMARELQRRHPELHVAVAHPGVVASELGGKPSAGSEGLRRRIMIPIELGAQTPLYCATQPIPRGVYLHNTLGEMKLDADDPAADAAAAERLWATCEALCA
jgi:NAD(P)-dependent dehydrogenase (short-subunit alcohol dehydrogenase family)